MKNAPATALILGILALAGCEPSLPGWIFQPFEGPGIDADGEVTATPGEEGQFVLATTFLPVRAESQVLFSDTMEPILAALDAEPPGLVGTSLARTIDASAYRTLSVWESEEAMFAFVLGDAHAVAISRAPNIEVEGEARAARWRINPQDVPPAWPDVVARLDREGRSLR